MFNLPFEALKNSSEPILTSWKGGWSPQRDSANFIIMMVEVRVIKIMIIMHQKFIDPLGLLRLVLRALSSYDATVIE